MHDKENSPTGRFARTLLVTLGISLLLSLCGAISGQALPTGPVYEDQQGYSQNPWALGVVIPDGSTLWDGSTLTWATVTNVTAVLQIPEITNTSGTVYAIVSLMTKDGVVLQTAFGIYPQNGSWLVYSMFIRNIDQYPQRYTWATSSSGPAAKPGDLVTISIYRSPEHIWSFKACNLNTSLSIQQVFGTDSREPPKRGDQEIFALESYSRDSSTFQNMGNLTLRMLLVDGRRMMSGWYPFADWDGAHNPLFIVGVTAPPQFIGVSVSHDGRAVWYYSGNWRGNGLADETGSILVALVILVGAALGGVLLSMRYIRKAVGGQSKEETGRTSPVIELLPALNALSTSCTGFP